LMDKKTSQVAQFIFEGLLGSYAMVWKPEQKISVDMSKILKGFVSLQVNKSATTKCP